LTGAALGIGGGAASAAGGAAGAAGTAGGLLSTIGSIANIAGLGVSIASGIVSGVQQAHANNLLGRIEESTRYMKIGIVDGASEMGLNIRLAKDRLFDIQNYMLSVQQPLLGDMKNATQILSAAIINSKSIALGAGNVGVFNAPGDSGIRISPESISALADALVSRLGSSGSGSGMAGPVAVDHVTEAMFRRFKQRGLDPTRA
jgi:hypothetical protein